MAPTGYSMTVNMDASNLCKVTKANGIKFFPAYLWLVTNNLNKQMENQDTFGDVHGVLSQVQTPPPASRNPLLLVLVPFRVIEQV